MILSSLSPTQWGPLVAAPAVPSNPGPIDTERYEASAAEPPVAPTLPAKPSFLEQTDYTRHHVRGERVLLSRTSGNVLELTQDGKLVQSLDRGTGGFVSHDFHELPDGGFGFFEATVTAEGVMENALTVQDRRRSPAQSEPRGSASGQEILIRGAYPVATAVFR